IKDAKKLRPRSKKITVREKSSDASPRTAQVARRSTAIVRPAASESPSDLDRQQGVAPRRSRRGAPVSERSAGPSRGGGRRKGATKMIYFVGLDWAQQEHAVWVLDERGGTVGKFTVAHTAAGLTELRQRLDRIASPSEMRVAIERPTGLLVDTLIEHGYTV